MSRENLMIDLETLDTKPTSVVLSVGAVLFDKNEIKKQFHSILDINEQLKLKRTMSESTLRWWVSKDYFWSGFAEKTKLDDFYNDFNLFLNEANKKELLVWARGTDFDISIMKNLFDQKDWTIPWRYNKVRDVRTFHDTYREATGKDLNDFLSPNKNPHNALEDSMHQASMVMAGLRELSGLGK